MTISSPTPSPFAPSPNRCSPLSQPPVYAPTRTPSPSPDSHTASSAASRPIPTPSRRRPSSNLPRSPISPLSSLPTAPHYVLTRTNPASSTPPTPSMSATATPPGTSSTTRQAGATPSPLSRSHPLLGSYPLSLLHSRMSAHRPHPLTPGFSLHLGALGRGKACPPELRCPPHLILPFSATYYDLEDEPGGTYGGAGGEGRTPWVGNVDVQEWYFETYSTSDLPPHPNPHSNGRPAIQPRQADPPPPFPGYRVAPKGQLQILIKTPHAACKAFLVPYDLRQVGVGGRLLVREKSYVRSRGSGAGEAEGKPELLRYAIQLQFLCVPAGDWTPGKTSVKGEAPRRRESSTTRQASTAPRAYYVSKSIRVVFTTSPPEPDEVLRSERTDERVEPAMEVKARERGVRVMGFSPGSMGEDWEVVKRRWMACWMDGVGGQGVPSGEGERRRGSRTRKPRDEAVKSEDEAVSAGGSGPLLPCPMSTTIPSRATSPLPIPILSPIAITLPLARLESSLSKSRPTTPIPPVASPQPLQALQPTLPGQQQVVQTQQVPTIWRPTGRRMTREYGLEERELSERLRRIELERREG